MDYRDVRVVADTGEGVDLENMRVFDTNAPVVVVSSDYAKHVDRTLVVAAHGLVVLTRGVISMDMAKTYREKLPEALRRAGILAENEGATFPVVGLDIDCPPLDGGAVDGDVQRLVVDLPADSEAAARVERVLQALGCSFRPIDGDGFATA